MVTSKLHPSVEEGWAGVGAWRAYALTKFHGQRFIKVALSEAKFMRMDKAERDRWLADARRRVDLGRL